MTVRLHFVLAITTLLVACGGSPAPTQIVAATPVPARSVAAASPTAPAEIKVYVTGAVAHPGVFTLTADSRVEDAIAAAGGFVEGADMPRVNLAAKLRDEEEIFVPKVGETMPAIAAGSS